MPHTIGRFEIRRELGRGAQSVVYLGFDPHLQREVAIKALHLDPARSRDRTQDDDSALLMNEARTVSKLRHPNIVPIFEAGQERGDPYLVFEYVPGRSLEQVLREEGRLSPPRAAQYMVKVLDALAHAHSEGIIHRDLKPSNILIDAAGMPRVMDFGISVRVSGGALREARQGLRGTPAYMAPEYVASRVVGASADLYAAGLVLLEMLTGRRAVPGAGVAEILERVADEPILLPDDMAVDQRLGNIILKACARDPEARYGDAGEMQIALAAYLEADDRVSASAQTMATRRARLQVTVSFLLRRMRHKTDFPALSASVSAINKLTVNENESFTRLADTILKDFALTNKILRLVNSVYFRPAGGGSISTVSRAAVVLGFDAIRNIALTVLLFEHLQDKANAGALKESFLRASFAALLARALSSKVLPHEAEQAFVCALFHGLGRLLAQYYFPEEMAQVAKLMEQKKISEEAAALSVLDIGFEDLGVGIARSWGFPKSIVGSMRKLSPGPIKAPATEDQTLHAIAGFANELCDAVTTMPPAERQDLMGAINRRYGESLQFSEAELEDTLERSIDDLAQIASVLQINLKQSSTVSRIRAWSLPPGTASAGAAGDDTRATGLHLADTILGATLVPGAGGHADGEPLSSVAAAPPRDAQTILAEGIQDISNSLVEEAALNDILRITLETMYRAMGFERVLMCLRDAKANQMVGRFGFGRDASEVARNFRFPLSYAPDVFHASLEKGLDICISDVADPQIRDRIPQWYLQCVTAQTFVLLPLMIKNRAVALIYCDKERAGEIVIPERELSLLKTLRNQAVLALKQAA